MAGVKYEKRAPEVEVRALAGCLIYDPDRSIAKTAAKIHAATDLTTQMHLISQLASGPSDAHRYAAETLTELAHGKMPCRLRPVVPQCRRRGVYTLPLGKQCAYDREGANAYTRTLRRIRRVNRWTQRQAAAAFKMPVNRWKSLEQQPRLGPELRAVADSILKECGESLPV